MCIQNLYPQTCIQNPDPESRVNPNTLKSLFVNRVYYPLVTHRNGHGPPPNPDSDPTRPHHLFSSLLHPCINPSIHPSIHPVCIYLLPFLKCMCTHSYIYFDERHFSPFSCHITFFTRMKKNSISFVEC